MPEQYIAALSDSFTMETRSKIPALWGRLWQHDFGIEGLDQSSAYGVSYGMSPDGSFNYAAGYKVDRADMTPAGGCIVTLSPGRYARFAGRVAMAEIPAFFDAAFSHGLSDSGLTQREGAVYEMYPDDPEATETHRLFELWIPVI